MKHPISPLRKWRIAYNYLSHHIRSTKGFVKQGQQMSSAYLTAQKLMNANVPHKHIVRAMRRLARQRVTVADQRGLLFLKAHAREMMAARPAIAAETHRQWETRHAAR